MTNEEIYRAAMRMLHDLGYSVSPQSVEVVNNALRALVSQAYAEAIQIANKRAEELHEAALDCNHASAIYQVATDIQELRDAIVLEPVS